MPLRHQFVFLPRPDKNRDPRTITICGAPLCRYSEQWYYRQENGPNVFDKESQP